MPRFLTAGLAVLALGLVPARGAPDGPPESKPGLTPKQQYQAVLDEYQKAQQTFSQKYTQAKTAEERSKIISESYPNPATYAERFLAIAEKSPDDPAAVDALVWAVQLGSQTDAAAKAVGRLASRHADDPRVGRVVSSLSYSYAPAAETLLRAVAEKGRDREARGAALMALGQFLNRRIELVDTLKNDPKRADQMKSALAGMGLDAAAFERLKGADPAAFAKEAETCFERVVKDYGDVSRGRGTLGKSAAAELNEIRNLGLGKPCPEIAGEDIDGKSFKLSDYKGKVVVVDFWGDW